MGNQTCGMSGRRAVAERLTRPQRLLRQPSDVDYRKLKKLILSRKLAPCFDAIDDPDQFVGYDLDECPICFLYFPSLNRSRCCTKGICTECFLQMKPSNSSKPAQCPFCKTSCYAVEYRGARTDQEKNLEQQEEQKVIEAKIRMQSESQAENVHVPITRPQTILDVLHSFPNSKGTSFGQSEHEEKEHIGNSTLHEDINVDSEVMIMESIWQSLQDSGLRIGESTTQTSRQSERLVEQYISNQEVFGTNQIDQNQYKKFMIESNNAQQEIGYSSSSSLSISVPIVEFTTIKS